MSTVNKLWKKKKRDKEKPIQVLTHCFLSVICTGILPIIQDSAGIVNPSSGWLLTHPWSIKLSHATFHRTYVILCHVMLCYVMLCYVMLCYVMSCYVMLYCRSNVCMSTFYVCALYVLCTYDERALYARCTTYVCTVYVQHTIHSVCVHK